MGSFLPQNTTCSNAPKASDIPLSEWKTHFSNKFAAPDATLESKYESELDEFLSVYLEFHYVITMQPIITVISKHKWKASSGIDNISVYHIIHGTPLLMSHLGLFMQMTFDTFTFLSSFALVFSLLSPR